MMRWAPAPQVLPSPGALEPAMKRPHRPASKKSTSKKHASKKYPSRKPASSRAPRDTSTDRAARPLREDLVLQACLEAYGLVRHEGRLADRALDFTLRRKTHLYSTERRAVAERVYALL